MRRIPHGGDESVAHGRERGEGGWNVVVPVKEASRAKTRLEPAFGERRTDLALAFAGDTVEAALACAWVASVTVVTRDPRAAAALSRAGARVVEEPADADLNAAIVYACGLLPTGRKVAVLLGDLPSVTASELTTAFDRARPHVAAFLADTTGVGTTLLTASHAGMLHPRFGRGSASAHRLAGAVRIADDGLAGLRRDVDSLADLREAQALGLGRRTRALLDEIGWLGLTTESCHEASKDRSTCM